MACAPETPGPGCTHTGRRPEQAAAALCGRSRRAANSPPVGSFGSNSTGTFTGRGPAPNNSGGSRRAGAAAAFSGVSANITLQRAARNHLVMCIGRLRIAWNERFARLCDDLARSLGRHRELTGFTQAALYSEVAGSGPKKPS